MYPRLRRSQNISMLSNKNSDYRISRFSEEHISAVAKIEAETFSEPWSESSLATLLTEAYPSFVLCEESAEVVGYLSSVRALDEIEIINVAVRADRKRLGYGEALLRALDGYCAEHGISQISLEVRESNAAAIALYEKCGYTQAGVRKNFYRLPTESALVMIKTFNSDRKL